MKRSRQPKAVVFMFGASFGHAYTTLTSCALDSRSHLEHFPIAGEHAVVVGQPRQHAVQVLPAGTIAAQRSIRAIAMSETRDERRDMLLSERDEKDETEDTRRDKR